MIERYSHKEMSEIWSDESRYRRWLKVELLICRGLAQTGLFPLDKIDKLCKKARIEPEKILQIEKETRHDVAAFVKAVGLSIPGLEQYFHFGVTSTDIVDTAQALAMVESLSLILKQLDRLEEILKKQAEAHRRTPIIGRTHGIHAEPITLGVKFLLMLCEARRNRQRLDQALDVISVGCISGAVGTYAYIPPGVEEYVCGNLGLRPAAVSTQVIQRDRYSQVMFALVLTASLCEKIALEFRHLQRTEVGEAEESFGVGQKGSSAMPHKKNPVGFEQICGLVRVLRGNLWTSLENIPLWHERDISHSSAERIIIPDSFMLCYHILKKTSQLLENLKINKSAMEKNVNMTRGLIYSQSLLLKLCLAGIPREDAYVMVQKAAMDVWENESLDFYRRVMSDDGITGILSRGDIREVFDINRFFRYIDHIYSRFE